MGPYERSAEVYDALYSTLVEYEANAGELQALIEARVANPQSVLEVACGTGAYVRWLRDWYDVTGLDLSPEMLRVARGRLPDVAFVEGDMTDFDLRQEFDAVLCLFSSIGYLTSGVQLRSALASMARHVVPGGVVLIEPWITPEGWDDDRNLTVHSATQDNLSVARIVSWVREENLVTMNWGFVVGRPEGEVEVYTEEHVTRLFTHEEYLEAFARAGLHVEHDAGGLMGRGLYIGTKRSSPRSRGAVWT